MDRADDPKRGIFLQGDPVITAPRRPACIHSTPGTSLIIGQFLDFVVESANLCLFQLDPAPLLRIGRHQVLTISIDLGTGRHASAFQLQKSVVCGRAGLVCGSENTPEDCQLSI